MDNSEAGFSTESVGQKGKLITLRLFLRRLAMAAPSAPALSFCDIGANLTDTMFHGEYHGSRKHDSDFGEVLDRSRAAGVKEIIITGAMCQLSAALRLFA